MHILYNPQFVYEQQQSSPPVPEGNDTAQFLNERVSTKKDRIILLQMKRKEKSDEQLVGDNWLRDGKLGLDILTTLNHLWKENISRSTSTARTSMLSSWLRCQVIAKYALKPSI